MEMVDNNSNLRRNSSEMWKKSDLYENIFIY